MRRLALLLLLPLLLLPACRGPAGSPAPQTPATAAAPPRVVIVGGGLAGLVSAYELGKRGIATALFEATDRWGGRVATAYYGNGGAYAEYGMQEMWADNPLLGIARELRVPLDDKSESPYSSVIIDGKLIPHVQPTDEQFFASFLDARERRALRSWMDAAAALRRQALAQAASGAANASALTPELERVQAASFRDWVGTFHLPTRVAEWIRLTIECELAADWDEFSGLAGLIEFGLFLGTGEANYHVRGGNARLIAALADAIPGQKLLSATVTAVERWKTAAGAPRARVTYMRNQRVETIEAERVILAVPWVQLHQIRLDPPLSDGKRQALSSLDRGDYTVVHLLVDRAARATWQVGDASPFPVLTGGKLGVVYGVMHESPPSEPLEVFSLLIHGGAAAAFHMVPREKKIAEILAGLDGLWPGLSAHVRSSQVFTYHPAAIAVWPPGRSPLDAGARDLRQPELGLYLAGDYTMSAHATGAVESAQAVAARISAELAPTAALPRPPPAPRPADRPAR